jgi:UDP-N-acetylglucosamine 2-epimerase (non-hydrolysing)
MNNKLKVVTVVGTRPEIIRLSRVIDRLDQADVIEHILIHTGQNYDYELNQIFFEDLNIRNPDYFLNAVGQTAADTIGQIISKIDVLFGDLNPDAVLILGDTNSCLCAIPAKKRHIPIFHMEAGNRCYDQRVPEETNRKIVDHISDINLTYSDIAREYLLREGLPADQIIKTGSPMFEVLNFYKSKIDNSNIINELQLVAGKYFVVSAHREENINDAICFGNLVISLNKIADQYNLPIIMSTHPRTRKKIEELDIKLSPHVNLLKPLSFSDYNSLQKHAFCVLSDSGTISEESSILNFPALNIRNAHERPEAMEEASVMMVGLSPERILQGISLASIQSRGEERSLLLVRDYSIPNVSEKVVRIIVSYVNYVKRVVWNE